MTRNHTVIEELMAVDALGGLDGDDRALLERERAAHGDCAECRAIEAGFAEAAGRLAFALTPEPVDEAMADRILAAAPPTSGDRPSDRVVVVPEVPRDEIAERRARRPRAWQALVAAAAVAAVAVVAVASLVPSSIEVSQASSSQRIVTFAGEGTEGTLAMAFTPGEPGAVFWGGGIPDPGADKVYEIWMIEDGRPVSGGCVTPTDGVIGLRVDANIGTTETMAVTTEGSDCPAAPTSEPKFLADLTTLA